MIVVDRIEGDRAVLEIGGETVEVPASALPPGTREGATLVLVASGDEAAVRQAAADRIARLTKTDLPDDIQL